MDPFLAALEGTAVAEFLRVSRWGYALVNTAHILGIALLVGAVVPLNLRLLGLWGGVSRAMLARVLVPAAACGLAIAVVAGAFLFSVRAAEYAAVGFLQLKLALVALGTSSAFAAHRVHGWRLEEPGRAGLRWHAVVSLSCWLGALLCGRMIAFADS